MTTMPGLQTALLDLLCEVKGTDVVIIIGGGYGIYLKTGHVQRLGKRTLFQEWPEPRSTNDLDLFLRPELLIDAKKLKPLAQAITRLGYQAVPGAEKYQFVKPGPGGGKAGSIKIDILTGPRTRFDGTTVKTDTRRARPNPSVGIHAHPVDETPTHIPPPCPGLVHDHGDNDRVGVERGPGNAQAACSGFIREGGGEYRRHVFCRS